MYFPLSSCESSSLFCFLARRAAGRRWKPSLKSAEEPRSPVAGRKKKKHVGGPLCGHMAAAELAMLRRRGVSLRVSVRGLFFFPLNRFIQFIEKKKKNLSLFPSHAFLLLRSPELNPGRARGREGWGWVQECTCTRV